MIESKKKPVKKIMLGGVVTEEVAEAFRAHCERLGVSVSSAIEQLIQAELASSPSQERRKARRKSVS